MVTRIVANKSRLFRLRAKIGFRHSGFTSKCSISLCTLKKQNKKTPISRFPLVSAYRSFTEKKSEAKVILCGVFTLMSQCLYVTLKD